MVKWERLDPEVGRTEWASILSEAEDSSPFQSYAWGEYKRRSGWEPERWVALNGRGTPACCLQLLKRRLPFNRVLVWAPGGPVAGFPEGRTEAIGEMLSRWLEEFRHDNQLLYARFRSHQRDADKASSSINRVCARPGVKVTTEYTVQIDLSRPLEELRRAMTSKHRYYIKQSRAAGLKWKFGNVEGLARDMAFLHQDMSRAKGIEHLRCEWRDLAALSEEFGKDCLFLVGYHDEDPVTACLVLTVADKAFYLLAATGTEGRRISAAYTMVFELFELLKSSGVTRFDFGGIDPLSPSARGVDHFKRGFGGEVVKYLGEWEWVRSRCVRMAVNYLLRMRVKS